MIYEKSMITRKYKEKIKLRECIYKKIKFRLERQGNQLNNNEKKVDSVKRSLS